MPPNNCHGSLTKIVATIGPTSEQLPVLQELVHAGMTVMRLNFSHATVEEVELRTTNLKACKVRRFCARFREYTRMQCIYMSAN